MCIRDRCGRNGVLNLVHVSSMEYDVCVCVCRGEGKILHNSFLARYVRNLFYLDEFCTVSLHK